MSTLLLVAGFLASAAFVVVAGVTLARNGDVIAARTSLGGLWVGSVFLAIATSLPELATDVAAVRIGEPDLAAGDLFGSSMSNMFILAVVSLVPRGESLFRKATFDHALYACLAIILACIAAIFIIFRSSVTVLGLGPGSILLAVTYLAGSRAIFRHSMLAQRAGVVVEMGAAAHPVDVQEGVAPPPSSRTLRGAIGGFVAASALILVAAPLFAYTAAGLATRSGLGATFFGTMLVGFATSLPELVTSLAAVRLRAYDLAVGNLFGSNALNMAMFVPLDLAHPAGAVMASVSPVHAMSALVGIVLMSIGLAALVFRAREQRPVLEPGAALLILGYLGGLGLIYLQTSAAPTH